MFHTTSTWFLTLLLFLPVLGWARFRRRRSAIRFSSTARLAELPLTWKQRLRWVPNAMLLGAIALMIIGLARPQEGRKQTVSESEGIAIEMVVDRSGSMQAMDFQIDGQHVDRLTAIKKVAGEFVMGGDGLEGRFSDLVGLITFAGYAEGVTPSTLDHAFLVGQLNQTQIVTRRPKTAPPLVMQLRWRWRNLMPWTTQNSKVKSKVADSVD